MTKVCFIGSGNMAEALIGGMIDSKIFSKKEIIASDISEERLSYIKGKFDVNISLNEPDIIKEADIVILAIKPQCLSDTMTQLCPHFDPNSLIISILAGTSISKLENYFCPDSNKRVARVMPNLGAFERKSVSAIAYNELISANDKTMVKNIFKCIGYVHEVEEKEINLITAVSGSGPGYIFYFMEVFIEAAKKLGMDDNYARAFCLETLEGAYYLLKKETNTPSSLKDMVTSKGGTTEAALKVLQEKGLKDTIFEAVKAAHQRALELGGD